jgi:hypothetical protein
MTTGAAVRVRDNEDYYCIDEDEFYTLERDTSGSTERQPSSSGGIDRATFADRWQYTDIITELVDELSATGRIREAAAVKRVLGHDDDEAAMRAYVSRLWAEDWNSPEDSVYDD